MKLLKLVWLPLAQRLRFAQLDYIAEQNPAAALRLDTEIEQQADRLQDHPDMGRVGRVTGTREQRALKSCASCMARSDGRHRPLVSTASAVNRSGLVSTSVAVDNMADASVKAVFDWVCAVAVASVAADPCCAVAGVSGSF